MKKFFAKIFSKIKPGFWLYFAIYGLVLVILSVCFLIYTENTLREYERSQSDNVIASYMQEIKTKALSGQLPSGIYPDAVYNKLGLDHVFTDAYTSQFVQESAMSFKKTNYDTDAPAYAIYADDVKVAEITLKAKNSRTVFAILTVSDWQLASIKPVLPQAMTGEISITIPDSHTLSIAGTILDASCATKTDIAVDSLDGFTQYMKKPFKLVQYTVPTAVISGDIIIKTADGTVVDYTPDANGDIYVDYIRMSETVPTEFKDIAVKAAVQWDNFLTFDLTGSGNGLSAIEPYLIEGSALHQEAQEYAKLDITFTSAHYTSQNQYSEIVADHYVQYTEDCFSVHVKFDKTMYLYKKNMYATNNIDADFFFVLDNGTWKLVGQR